MVGRLRASIIFCLVFAVGLCLGSRTVSAQDSVRYTAGPSFSFPADGDLVSIDLDRDGEADFSFSGGLFLCTTDIPVSGCTTSFSVIPQGTNSLLCNGSQLAVMPAGGMIGPSSTNGTWTAYASATLANYSFSPRFGTSGWGGPLNALKEGYFGVRFQGVAGQHYGWVRARMAETNSVTFSPEILDWAFESQPDTAIKAGAMPVAAITAPKIVRPEKLRIDWATEAGMTYQVQYKEKLDAPGWTNLDIVVIATGTNAIVDLPIRGAVGFYQAVRTE